jgi:hypothetical protein
VGERGKNAREALWFVSMMGGCFVWLPFSYVCTADLAWLIGFEFFLHTATSLQQESGCCKCGWFAEHSMVALSLTGYQKLLFSSMSLLALYAGTCRGCVGVFGYLDSS